MMMNITTNETMRIVMMICSICEMNPNWNDFSVSVSVSASEFLNSASIALAMSAVREGSSTSMTNVPICSMRRGYFCFNHSLM